MHHTKISVIGLGYVGLPVAVAFGQQQEVIGFDINPQRIQELKQGIDKTKEVPLDDIKKAEIYFTTDPENLRDANFHIIAVPTPIDEGQRPNLKPLLEATQTVGKILKKGDIVVYESTVYPGATEEECIPVLEHYSGLTSKVDFFVGYSPERINPGDKEHSFKKITKVVSAQNEETLKIISEVYAGVVSAGVYEASSIKVAEAAKVIENTQRDINIAFINELSQIFNLMNLNIYEVLEAAASKWNFLSFAPGLVGGHCIGVDPYYLTYKAEQMGYHPQVILSGRRINDGMGKYIAERCIKEMIKRDLPIGNDKVAILGFSFKENCSDVRNTKVLSIINELKTYKINTIVIDPIVDIEDAFNEYQIVLSSLEELKKCKVAILAVAHEEFKTTVYTELLKQMDFVLDVKNIYKLPNQVNL